VTESAPSRPSLKRELILNFALIGGAAISLAVVTALVGRLLEPQNAALGLTALVVADVAILFFFGRHLIERLVLRPLGELTRAADELASGNLEARAAPASTHELAHLADRFNRMTERLADTQEELVRAEKLATVGRLAAGVAHEIGNPLAALGTYLDVLARRGAEPEVVAGARREAERIDRIVRSLLTYAAPGAEATGHVDVGSVMRGVVSLLAAQGTVPAERVTLEIAESLPFVAGRSHALEQVFVNLLLNALDAAPDGPITFGAEAAAYRPEAVPDGRRSDAGPPPARRGSGRHPRRPELGAGTRGVLVWVSDGGPGVPPEDRGRVFDPFYTTKPPGHGTGLGLAIVQSAVYEMGGVVWVDDAREGGAAFRVFLPAVKE
jgi:signal transduction histidine kinase